MIIGAIGATEPLTESEKEWIAAQIQQIIGQENPTLALTTLHTPLGKIFAQELWAAGIPYRVLQTGQVPRTPEEQLLIRQAVALQILPTTGTEAWDPRHTHIAQHSDFLLIQPTEKATGPWVAPASAHGVPAILLLPRQQMRIALHHPAQWDQVMHLLNPTQPDSHA